MTHADWQVGDCVHWIGWTWQEAPRALHRGTVERVTRLYLWVRPDGERVAVRRDRGVCVRTRDEAWALLMQEHARAVDEARDAVTTAVRKLAKAVTAYAEEVARDG